VAIYKTCLLLQKTLAGGKQRAADTFFAGLIGGWMVFGERNAVNEQVSCMESSSGDMWSCSATVGH
jgi:peroxisomal membrane protein 4